MVDDILGNPNEEDTHLTPGPYSGVPRGTTCDRHGEITGSLGRLEARSDESRRWEDAAGSKLELIFAKLDGLRCNEQAARLTMHRWLIGIIMAGLLTMWVANVYVGRRDSAAIEKLQYDVQKLLRVERKTP